VFIIKGEALEAMAYVCWVLSSDVNKLGYYYYYYRTLSTNKHQLAIKSSQSNTVNV